MADFDRIGFPRGVGYGVFFFGAATSNIADEKIKRAVIKGTRELIDQIDPRRARFDWYQLRERSGEHPNGYPARVTEMPAWIKQHLFTPAGINCTPQLTSPEDTVYCEFEDPSHPDFPPVIICYENFTMLDESGAPLAVKIQIGGTAVDCGFSGTLARAIDTGALA